MAKRNWSNIDVAVLDFNDKKTWELIQKGWTDGVFQLESTGMKETCIDVHPTEMEHLIAILALYRPDTMSELVHFIKRKKGEEEVTYIHPDLEPILESTYGCMIYQEQIMAVTKVFAGFSDAEADKFRKGIGKKKPEIVKENADKFHARCLAKGYDIEIADALTDILKKMGGYCFNKGHATGYGITSYKTAWLKANHSVEFMCALLTNQKKVTGATDYENVGLYLMKCNEMGITVNYPDINNSVGVFSISKHRKPVGVGVDMEVKEIVYGLNLIKGVGANAVEAIMRLRPFNSFEDFLERTDNEGVINKTVTISLIKSGAFDFTNESRADMLTKYGQYRFKNGKDEIKPIKNVNKTHIEKMLQANILKPYEKDDKELCIARWNKWREMQHSSEWENEVLVGDEFRWEYDSISYHLRGNPFAGVDIPSWDSYDDDEGRAKVGGTVISIKKTKIKRGRQIGKTMAFINLDTIEGVREVVVFADDWSRHQDKLEKGAMVVIRGKKEGDKLTLNGCKTLDEYKETEL